MSEVEYPLTFVSGFWIIENKHDDKYYEWFERTLQINCPYVFFGNAESIKIVKKYRKDLPTHYVLLEIKDFYTYRFYDDIQTHPRHCPSKELNMIWNEKLFLIQKAMSLNVYKSEFYGWIDAGVCTYREKDALPPKTAFPDVKKLMQLPKDKMIFSSTDCPEFMPQFVNDLYYYHYVSGSSYILHKTIVDGFLSVYKSYLDHYLPKKDWKCTDQVLMTYMLAQNPRLFYKLTDGYGNIVSAIK
jgi:hypothetical protein